MGVMCCHSTAVRVGIVAAGGSQANGEEVKVAGWRKTQDEKSKWEVDGRIEDVAVAEGAKAGATRE